MTLGPIFLCCDDLNIYRTDFVEGDGWSISLEEFQADELRLPALPRPKGQSRAIPRPARDPDEIIQEFGLPIASVRFIEHRGSIDSRPEQVAIYAIRWRDGQPFPRRLLPANAQPITSARPERREGTYCCYTAAHRNPLKPETSRA